MVVRVGLSVRSVGEHLGGGGAGTAVGCRGHRWVRLRSKGASARGIIRLVSVSRLRVAHRFPMGRALVYRHAEFGHIGQVPSGKASLFVTTGLCGGRGVGKALFIHPVTRDNAGAHFEYWNGGR